ncbi:MAG: pyruvate formate-lyase-activating protein [Bacteroidota bacterium]|nr:pyruvate formate-lyase-activating protein [Bacteroidota bacterium]
MQLRVHSYESMGLFDGPGLRLVVFLQGCRFRCLYCANPDTIPSVGGTLTDPEEIVRMALSEKTFFGKKGGVTFSGGEPTLQAEALIPLCKRLKEEGIHLCLDTNGNNFNERTKALYQYIDMALLDVKEIDPERHRILTGHSNEQTLQTAAWLEEIGKPMRIRYVLVPGYSDFLEDLQAFGEHFKNYQHIDRLELLPYHTFGVHKYKALGKPYLLEDIKEDTPERIQEVKELFEQYFRRVWVQ